MTAFAEQPSSDASRRQLLAWSAWFVALVALTLALLAVRPRLDKAHVALSYLLVVLGASASGGRVLGLTIAGAAFLAFNFFFLLPYHTLVISDPLDWLVLVTFLVTSVVAAQLLYRATSTAEVAVQRAQEIERLAALGAETLSAPTADEALQAIVVVIRESIQVETCEVYRRGSDGTLMRAAIATIGETADRAARLVSDAVGGRDGLVDWLSANGQGAIEMGDGTVRLGDGLELLRHLSGEGRLDGQPSRTTTDRSPIRALLLSLTVREHTVGVLRISASAGIALTPAQVRLLDALAYYAALGVERVRLVESIQRVEGERHLESLRNALFTAVSHDLRTPLTTIKGIAHELAHGGDLAGAAVIEAEADRMNALVEDLLDLSRIHAGAVRPNIEVNTADDLIGVAMQRSAGVVRGRSVELDMPPDELLAGHFDLSQSVRALTNLLENAVKYGAPDAPIMVRARRHGNRLLIAVLDRGPGVPAAESELIFQPFFRRPGAPADIRGTGLGLSIARGLVEAQGGTIRYEDRPGGGAVFVLELPAANPPQLEDELPEAEPL